MGFVILDVLALVSTPKLSPPERRKAQPTIAEMFGGVVAREKSALAAFYDATKSYVFGLTLRIVHDRAVAEEITLDVYTQVWRDAARYRSDRSGALSWLLMIARSRAIDHLRSKAGKAREREYVFDPTIHEFRDHAPNPQEALELSSRAAAVRRALSDLSPDKREAIELAFFGGMSHSEIAARLGAPLGTVKTRIRAGMGQLKAQLMALGESR